MRNRTFVRAVAIGQELSDIMAEQDVSQVQLAARVGTDQGTISRYLAGRHDMSVTWFHRICVALNTTEQIVLDRVNSRYRHVAA